MSEVEKQEGQKTVIAFFAGLLIGALLVWVFAAPQGEEHADHAEEAAVAETTGSETEAGTEENTETETAETEAGASAGALEVADQAAGEAVALASAQFPTTDGWVAIRDYDNGVVGGILGAARYSQSQGLIPESVELLRATEAGKTYAAVFFTEDGSVNEAGKLFFDPKNDQQIEGVLTQFTAQ